MHIGEQPASALHRPLHLRRLEAEAIGIIREVAAEFRNPVMLYSIGKDSSVMLHLARKAFFPGKPPFPLLHIDTGWKFREMIAFRDETARQLGLDLIIHVNEEGKARGVNPITSGSALHTAVMKTDALKQALNHHGFDAAKLRAVVQRPNRTYHAVVVDHEVGMRSVVRRENVARWHDKKGAGTAARARPKPELAPDAFTDC